MIEIKVIAIGGAGVSFLRALSTKQSAGFSLVSVDTDRESISSHSSHILRIEEHAPNEYEASVSPSFGLATGATETIQPELGQTAALGSYREISSVIEDAEVVFIVAGMGGSIGTGAAPVIAEIAQSHGVAAIAVVTVPFHFENRTEFAENGISKLAPCSDVLVTVPHEKLVERLGEKTEIGVAFKLVDNLVADIVQRMTSLVSSSNPTSLDPVDIIERIKEISDLPNIIGTGGSVEPSI